MRVLYLIHSSTMDGSTISFVNMITGLKAKGVEIIVACPNMRDELTSILKNNSIKYISVNLAPLMIPWNTIKDVMKFPFRYVKRYISGVINSRKLAEIVDEIQPDIIHSNVGVVHEGYTVCQKKHIPHIWHLREYQDKDFGWIIYPSKTRFIRKLKSSHVIAISKGIFEHFKCSYPKDRVIYNGIRNEADVSYDSKKEDYFLCASRIDSSKGHHDVIKAFSQFHKKHPNFKLKILGFGAEDYIDYLKKLITDSGLHDNVQFEGYKKSNEVSAYMKKAKALIVASYYEGFGRMTAEAAFSGCLVIGRNTGGTSEILHTTGGFLFNNINELANCMETVTCMGSNEYLNQVIRAQEKAVKVYSIEANVQRVYDYYTSIIQSSN